MRGILANALCLTKKSRLSMGVLLPGVNTVCSRGRRGKDDGAGGRSCACTRGWLA